MGRPCEVKEDESRRRSVFMKESGGGKIKDIFRKTRA